MSILSQCAFALMWLIFAAGCWLGWQLLRQNGRILLRLDEVEKRLDELEFEDRHEPTGSRANGNDSGGPAEEDRVNRFADRSLARSRIKRDGLKAGTPAPDFRLPCLDGTERSLQDYRGRRMLLVFSDPNCGPCQALAPHLQTFHGEQPELAVLMVSRGDPKENRAKIKEHGLTFPVLLQQRWEISRLYAMFATPIAYLIDERGVILMAVAVGVDRIQALLTQLRRRANHAEAAVR